MDFSRGGLVRSRNLLIPVKKSRNHSPYLKKSNVSKKQGKIAVLLGQYPLKSFESQEDLKSFGEVNTVHGRRKNIANTSTL